MAGAGSFSAAEGLNRLKMNVRLSPLPDSRELASPQRSRLDPQEPLAPRQPVPDPFFFDVGLDRSRSAEIGLEDRHRFRYRVARATRLWRASRAAIGTEPGRWGGHFTLASAQRRRIFAGAGFKVAVAVSKPGPSSRCWQGEKGPTPGWPLGRKRSRPAAIARSLPLGEKTGWR